MQGGKWTTLSFVITNFLPNLGSILISDLPKLKVFYWSISVLSILSILSNQVYSVIVCGQVKVGEGQYFLIKAVVKS